MYLVGDFVPQKTQFAVPDFGDELVLVNLEGPVCRDGLKPIAKVGPHLHSSPFELKGRWAFTLANNHLMDYRAEGLWETESFLKSQGFPFGGAGENETEARRILWLPDQEKKIAVICCCEHQFGVAEENAPGVAAQGPWVLTHIRQARNEGADVVIVSSHAGSESTKFVSPRLRALYHSWIDAGADVIHGHHAHIPQGWEAYHGKLIFYGLGNFVVDPAMWKNNPDQLWSLAVHLDFSCAEFKWEVRPVGSVPTYVQSYLDEANAIFRDDALMREKWRKTAIEQYARFYRPYLTFSLKGFLSAIRYPRRYRLIRANFCQCENHVDIISAARSVK